MGPRQEDNAILLLVTVSLICACKDEDECHRSLLRGVLETAD